MLTVLRMQERSEVNRSDVPLVDQRLHLAKADLEGHKLKEEDYFIQNDLFIFIKFILELSFSILYNSTLNHSTLEKHILYFVMWSSICYTIFLTNCRLRPLLKPQNIGIELFKNFDDLQKVTQF